MRRLRILLRTAATIALLLLSLAPAAGQEAAAGSAKSRVTYVTGSSIYVDAGRDAGLVEGDRLEVVRDGRTVAILVVVYLSSQRVSCALAEGSAEVQVGDIVLLPARLTELAPESAPATASAATVAPVPTAERSARRAQRPLRGRVGLRYLWVSDRSGSGSGFSQPALDLRLDGTDLAGGRFDLAVDVRSRMTYRTRVDGLSESESRTRAYRLAAAWHDPASRMRLSIGRQFSPSLASVSIFDGVLLELDRERWHAGVFGGTQPDPVDYGLSDQIREYGGFLRFNSAPDSPRRWSLATGAIGSYDQGEINREFAFLQGDFSLRRLSGYFAQEIDYNRGWKADAGESTVSPTSTFVTVRYRPAARAELHAGFDNRRNVRLYRDFVTPETEFDDRFREGVWVGGSFGFGPGLRAGLDVKSSGGGSAGNADAATFRFTASGLSSRNLSLSYRGTVYSNDRLDGWLHSAWLGITLGSRYNLALSAGLRDETGRGGLQLDNQTTWVGLELAVDLGSRWYLLLSVERNDGDLDNNDQGYVSLTYRF